jgi:hypothetical protein
LWVVKCKRLEARADILRENALFEVGDLIPCVVGVLEVSVEGLGGDFKVCFVVAGISNKFDESHQRVKEQNEGEDFQFVEERIDFQNLSKGLH